MNKLERKNFDYIKKFAVVGRQSISSAFHLGVAWRAYYCLWVIESVKKTELRLFTGIGKTRKEAVESTWKNLSKQLKKGKIKMLKDELGELEDKGNYQEISFISLAPAVIIPKEYGEYLKFYYK